MGCAETCAGLARPASFWWSKKSAATPGAVARGVASGCAPSSWAAPHLTASASSCVGRVEGKVTQPTQYGRPTPPGISRRASIKPQGGAPQGAAGAGALCARRLRELAARRAEGQPCVQRGGARGATCAAHASASMKCTLEPRESMPGTSKCCDGRGGGEGWNVWVCGDMDVERKGGGGGGEGETEGGGSREGGGREGVQRQRERGRGVEHNHEQLHQRICPWH